MNQRFPEFWITWLTPLLAGEDSCEWRAWVKANYWKPPKFTRTDLKELYPANKKFAEQDWDSEHTAMLDALRDEYAAKSESVYKEVPWKIKGNTALISGKIDLVTFGPNLIVDAKTGKQKNSHVLQIRAYLLAAERLYPDRQFKGVLRYPSDVEIEVTPESGFKDKLYRLVKRLAGDAPPASPAYSECRFCDLADCAARATEEQVFETADF
jgi:hypothetical protein